MRWNKTSYLSFFSFGSISFASFVLAALTGIFLAIPFDVKNPFDSISVILLVNPAATLLRSLHYWSAQAFLISTLLHIWDHLKSSSEKRVKKGIWLRLTISILIVFFIMISGFILKGDAESVQARSIFRSLFESIPLIGRTMALSLTGFNNDYQVIYVHHIATATVFLWLIIAEHARSIWPKIITISGIFPVLFIVSFFFIPSLHDTNAAIVKGPWYFTGLQEIFHWLSFPQIVIIPIIVFLLLFYYLQSLGNRLSNITKKVFVSLWLCYLLLCIFSMVFRGEDWDFSLPWKSRNITGVSFNPELSFIKYFNAEYIKKDIPVVLGRREGCLYCHDNVKGLSVSHDPKAIGCVSCHLGNPFTLNKSAAHNGMILIPGDVEMAKLSCGTQNCHPDIPVRIKNSIMNTMSGVISVDKFVFGEIQDPNGSFDIKNSENSAADNHLRNLCASCHTGNKKEFYGPVTELSRGGGCNACHLAYSTEALNELKRSISSDNRIKKNTNILFHPSLTVNVSDNHCFGCHSRSGRISLNYEGWHETQLSGNEFASKPGFRLLEDGRVFTKVQLDVHFEKGMSCIDCHVAKEVMGNRKIYPHKEDQVIIRCTDCHTSKFNSYGKEKLDQEAEKIISLTNNSLMNYTVPVGNKIIFSAEGNIPILNARTDSKGKGFLIVKGTGKTLPLKAPAKQCTAGKAHARLACTTCHSSWAPQCIGCHTGYNPEKSGFDLLDNKEIRGEWEETPGDFLAEAPVLGIRSVAGKNDKKEEVTNFIPGMIMSLDKSKFNKNSSVQGTLFRRLFAPAFPHTITRKARSCESCHLNPLALGYGRGELKYEIKGAKGKWIFKPKYNLNKSDNLPEDAWTGFLKERKDQSTTRSNTRPFNVEEQKKILTAGACFFCHKPESFYIYRYLINKQSTVLSKKCILPAWQLIKRP